MQFRQAKPIGRVYASLGHLPPADLGLRIITSANVIGRDGFDELVHVNVSTIRVLLILNSNCSKFHHRDKFWNAFYGLKPQCDWPSDLRVIDQRILRTRREVERFALCIRCVANVGWRLENNPDHPDFPKAKSNVILPQPKRLPA